MSGDEHRGRWPVFLQQFELISLGNEQYQIRNPFAAACMDVPAEEDPELADLRLRECREVDGQHWTFAQTHDAAGDPNLEIKDLPVAYEGSDGLQNVYTGQMLAGEPRGLPGTRVRADPHRTAPDPNGTEWDLQWVGQYLRLRDPYNDRCVEADDPPFWGDSLAAVDLRTCADSSAQLWEVLPYGEDSFRLRSRVGFDGFDACLSLPVNDEVGDIDIAEATFCDAPTGTQIWSFAPFSTATE